jgi:hypothetical protein
MGDTDESPEKIVRVEVLADITAVDRALHECAKRVVNSGVGRFEYLLGVADQRIQRGGDDLLGFDGSDEQQQPSSQGFMGGLAVGQIVLRRGQLFHRGAINRHQERFARRKVAV